MAGLTPRRSCRCRPASGSGGPICLSSCSRPTDRWRLSRGTRGRRLGSRCLRSRRLAASRKAARSGLGPPPPWPGNFGNEKIKKKLKKKKIFSFCVGVSSKKQNSPATYVAQKLCQVNFVRWILLHHFLVRNQLLFCKVGVDRLSFSFIVDLHRVLFILWLDDGGRALLQLPADEEDQAD